MMNPAHPQSTPSPPRSPLAALRRFAPPRTNSKPKEHCELCGAPLPPEHQHLLELSTRQLFCACDPCAILFTTQQNVRFRRVPTRIEFWPDFHMTDAQWDSLHIPINLAFFCHSTPAQRVLALFPSPAGATESLLTLDAWQDLLADNPALAQLEPDVEALLVNRIRQNREYYRVPIDQCFKLVGLIRTHWRGLAGGTDVWKQIEEYFASLRNRSTSPRRPHA